MPKKSKKRKIKKIGQKQSAKKITTGEAFRVIAEHLHKQNQTRKRKMEKKGKIPEPWDENMAHETPMLPAKGKLYYGATT